MYINLAAQDDRKENMKKRNQNFTSGKNSAIKQSIVADEIEILYRFVAFGSKSKKDLKSKS